MFRIRRILSHHAVAAMAHNVASSSKTRSLPRRHPPNLLGAGIRENHGSFSFARLISSKASPEQGETTDKNKKEITNVEDPFDSPTYNIPEKPVTFVEGASYSVIIIAGLGVAAAAGYAVFKELIFQPKE